MDRIASQIAKELKHEKELEMQAADDAGFPQTEEQLLENALQERQTNQQAIVDQMLAAKETMGKHNEPNTTDFQEDVVMEEAGFVQPNLVSRTQSAAKERRRTASPDIRLRTRYEAQDASYECQHQR